MIKKHALKNELSNGIHNKQLPLFIFNRCYFPNIKPPTTISDLIPLSIRLLHLLIT